MTFPDANATFLMNFFTSRDNNADGANNVGQLGRLWWNPTDNTIYVSDGVTPGGIPVSSGGGGTPAAPANSIQFNANGVFGGNAAFTYDSANANVNLSGNLVVANVGHIFQNSGISLSSNSIDLSFTFPLGYNGLSPGPLVVQDTAVIDVPDGVRWTIV